MRPTAARTERMAKGVERKRGGKPPPTEFGLRLVRIREARGFSRADLASKAEVTESLLCRLETYPRGSTEAETIFRLANALEVRPEWLWRGVEPRDISAGEKRLAELRRSFEKVQDDELAEAVRTVKPRHHQGIVAVAEAFARNGERHTVDGWIARLEEIAEKLSPLLPK